MEPDIYKEYSNQTGMNIIRVIRNYLKIIINAIWRKFTGHFIFPYEIITILNKNFSPHSNFFFVQVGANDGISNDFLYDFVTARKSKGIVIEPVTEYFNTLTKNYKQFPAVKTVNMAVHATEKRVEIFKVKSENLQDLPSWASGIASLNSEHHKASGISSHHIHSVYSNADTLMNILKDQNFLRPIDYLQIDVEGYDDQVIDQTDFDILKPKIIRFEYMNLSEETTASIIKRLKGNGYFCYYDAVDVIAIQPKDIYL